MPKYAYNNAIVYLEPHYDAMGKRTIVPKNIFTSNELNIVLNDINLVVPSTGNSVNIYCEDARAIAFTRYILSKSLNLNLDLYMNFIDINLGWTNYVQLYEKGVPEFRNNIILLDGDVPEKKEYKSKEKLILESQNILFLPLVIERDLFDFLKDHENFIMFSNDYSKNPSLTYDVCFGEWPLESDKYNTKNYKDWYSTIERINGNQNILFKFWVDKNQFKISEFIEKFISIFNNLAEIKDADALPPLL